MTTICADIKNPHVKDFIQNLFPGRKVRLLRVTPRQESKPLFCFQNVRNAVEAEGGQIIYGWSIWEWPNIYIEAEHHAVWKTKSGAVVDITPATDGDQYRLFVEDLDAVYDFKNEGHRRDNIKKLLRNDVLIHRFFDLVEMCNKIINDIPGMDIVDVPIQVARKINLINRQKMEIAYQLGMKYTRPNSLCFCGSGSKFKKCHGK